MHGGATVDQRDDAAREKKKLKSLVTSESDAGLTSAAAPDREEEDGQERVETKRIQERNQEAREAGDDCNRLLKLGREWQGHLDCYLAQPDDVSDERKLQEGEEQKMKL
jgi:hypothetical protein